MPTKMNKRTGQVLFEVHLYDSDHQFWPAQTVLSSMQLYCLVPSARLELAQLSPLPPQDSVSTNFTTTALVLSRSMRQPEAILLSQRAYRVYPENAPVFEGDAGNIASSGHFAGNLSRRRMPAAAGGRCRLRPGHWTAAPSSTLPSTWRPANVAKIGQNQGAGKEHGGQHSAVVRDRKFGAARRAEQAARAAAAEGRSHVSTLAVLHQDQAHHAQRGQASGPPE